MEVRNLTVAIKNIARACGDEISERQPMLDARLEDGSRVAAMFPSCAVDGPTLTVRKFTHRFTIADLIAVGTLTAPLAHVLRAAVEARQNILISDGAGTGKTTLLNAASIRVGFFEDFKGADTLLLDVDPEALNALIAWLQTVTSSGRRTTISSCPGTVVQSGLAVDLLRAGRHGPCESRRNGVRVAAVRGGLG